MTHLEHVLAPDGVAPGNGYSQVVSGTGRLVAVSGQVSADQDGNPVHVDDPWGQARQVFLNLARCLAAAGASFDDVVKLTFFVRDPEDLPALREARDEHVRTDRPPASSAVAVADLFRPEFLFEVEAFAVVSDEAAAPGRSTRS